MPPVIARRTAVSLAAFAAAGASCAVLALAGASAAQPSSAQPSSAQASSAPASSAQGTRNHGDPQAEAYVQAQSTRALTILNDRAMGVAAKKQAFYDFVNQTADVPRITDFVLGRYRRSLTPAQYTAFANVFREYADSVYETRLSEYQGEKLQVTGSVVHRPGDVVVTSNIIGGEFAGQPSVVNWRVLRSSDGNWRVVDVQAKGVWLAVVEQQDFTSTLANANGNVDVLIRQLRSQLAQGGAGGRS